MNSPEAFAFWVQAVFLAYFVAINAYYLALNAVAAVRLRQLQVQHRLEPVPDAFGELLLPISLLVPAYDEQETIVASIRSMLQLRYAEFEIVVVNDGSRDATLARLIEAFDLREVHAVPWRQLPCAAIRGVYRSPRHPNLLLVDKNNGGKADALNAGINYVTRPLFCAVDADSILEHDSLARIVRPFVRNRDTVAAGGTVRLANGCRIRGGHLESVGMPANRLARIQIVEYLRAFLFGRLGWDPSNGVLIVSGAFGLFRKSAVVEAGGYRPATIGEDMELVMRLHRICRRERRAYSIAFLPDPVCWTEAPEDLRTLRHQRRRWQQGLMESLWANRSLLLHPRGGAAGWLAFPAVLLFEGLGPVVELLGYALVVALWAMGAIDTGAMVAFVAAALALGLMVSASALLLEQLAFRRFQHTRHAAALVGAIVLENLGYRQLTALWRVEGLARWLRGRPGQWGEMKRTASWQDGGR